MVGGGGRRENESARRERGMESVRGRMHLTSSIAHVHMQQSCFLCLFV